MLEDEGYRLMGAAFEVYNQLGYGMAEEIYQQSLAVEFELGGIPFEARPKLAVRYRSRLLVTHYQPDFIVFNAIVVELKASADLITDHEAQLFNYMRIANQQVGYLLNFGRKGTLQWKRFILSDLRQKGKEH